MEGGVQTRSVTINPGRMKAIKENWMRIYTPIVEIGKVQVRMNIKSKCVEMRVCEHTEDPSYLDKSAKFIEAISIGFPVDDAITTLKLNDVFLYHFKISEVKTLKNLHIERAIGRMIGRNGKMKDAVENFSESKVMIKDQTVYILGSVEAVKIAKDAMCRLIMGSKPSSIFNRLRIIGSRLKEKYGDIQTIYNDP